MSTYSDDEEPTPSPLILLYSHARTNPPSSPDLTYDLRAVHSPPKPLRDKHTGTDKRLREHMLTHGDFVALLDRAEAEIKSLMNLTLSTYRLPPRKSRQALGRRLSRTLTGEFVVDGADGAGFGKGGRDDDGDEEEEGLEEGDRDRPRLKIGVFDVRGRHRSVAFVEELKGREWPAGWEVRGFHRDLQREKEGRRGSLVGKGRRGSMGRGFLGVEEESD